ncbi:hypothetical protein [Pedobacter rhizosphaerae]|uniref:DUF1735 domain-containing protein n=1 Tax=Pedobacter rhizosphaerae TaxID=390241 RepID=A0A1H9UQE9_9SPHI|nr:hypothetical protein [Pedobacter rhizosphaerae]SES11750.1 hypothetical protein SAMN04488023_13311 [Pedobacter rhizosphaerae]
MKSIATLICAVLILAFSACKKTIGLDPLAQNQITQYKVISATDTIFGAIDQIKKTITVYIPAYSKLNIIDPEISLSTGARLQSAILPVKLTDANVSYTVVAADQSTNTYKLNIVVLQEKPMVASVSYSYKFAPNNPISIGGNFYTTNASDITVTLVDDQGKETEALKPDPAYFVISASGSNVGITSLMIPTVIAEGNYKVKVKVFNETAYSTSYALKYVQPDFAFIGPTVKAGGTFKIVPNARTIFLNFTSLKGIINGVTYDFPIVSYTPTEATIQLPANLTAPQVNTQVQFIGSFTGWADAKKSALITITE